MFDKDTIYIVGDAQSSSNNPITQQFSAFFIGLVVDTSNDKIVEAACSATVQLTSDFARSLFIGHSIYASDAIGEEIRLRYFGSSQKTLIAAFKDAQKKYKQAITARSKAEITKQPTS
ncbi:hypothetical protein J31TS6_64090 [Brevibacillus reuszeri]|uniref:DUF3870 domain-containing protein n=1 Tax=Brevibacillus reuszeri TaxID=54915 RepID=UPI001B245E43|nr:DUF3870 domain-containing protein [Brevibacillus reuszeri]GIO10381.1 hypothetical protein J31TS6_64090 [Brevibacillus reuszeri]